MMCKRCVMDETDPDIVFTKTGCNHCDAWYSNHAEHQQLKPLETRFNELKKGKEYDAVLGVSGGLDSSYTAYLAYQYGLNCLLVHFDNGYDTPEGSHNVETIQRQTGWDLVTNGMDLDEFHDMQLSYLKAGVVNLEALSDHAIKADLFNTVKETGIKTVLSGSNWVTEGILPRSWGYRNDDLRNILDIHATYGKLPTKTFPRMGLLDYGYRVTFGGVREVKPLNHTHYNVEEAKNILTQDWGWIDYGWKHHESIITRFYQAYILPYRWGVDKRKAHLSTLICSGQKTREEALKTLKINPFPYPQIAKDRDTICRKLGLDPEELQAYLDQPKRSHSDYETNRRTLQLLRMFK